MREGNVTLSLEYYHNLLDRIEEISKMKEEAEAVKRKVEDLHPEIARELLLIVQTVLETRGYIGGDLLVNPVNSIVGTAHQLGDKLKLFKLEKMKFDGKTFDLLTLHI